MDPLYMANSLLRRRRYEECVQACTEILETNPYDQVIVAREPITPNHAIFLQAAWFLKLRALTAQTYVDEVEMDEEGIAEAFLDDTAIADVASELNVQIDQTAACLHLIYQDRGLL